MSESATTNVAARPAPVLELNEAEVRNNRIFKATGFTYKTAIPDAEETPARTFQQIMSDQKKEHKDFLDRLFDEDPKEKMKYMKAKMQRIRVTG